MRVAGVSPSVDVVVDLIRSKRFRYANEDELQRGLAAALAESALSHAREAILDARNRIDFLVGAVGIEVKVAGNRHDVARQCNRYLRFDAVQGLVLVTCRVRHLGVLVTPPEGKEFRVVTLAAAGL